MSERAWTPGPWWVDEDHEWADKDGGFTVFGPRDGAVYLGLKGQWPIAEVGDDLYWDEPAHKERDLATARLIAAAPDLYEALVEMRRWVAFDGGAGDTAPPIESMVAALARAEGRS